MRTFSPGEIAAAKAHFDTYGYVVFRRMFEPDRGRAFWRTVEASIAGNADLTYSVWGKFFSGPDVPLEGKRLPRITDIESHVAETRALMLGTGVTTFLRDWYDGRAPTCLQTLTYKFSSEQGAHSDKLLVRPPWAPDYDCETLVAAWFALEPSRAENGALIVYPGSHRLEKPDLSSELATDYGAYSRALDELCRDAGLQPQTFEAEPGDVLFWHGDLVHAGGAITSDAAELPTRKSLVCHYAVLPTRRRSRDPGVLRVRYGRGYYFHKRPFLPPLKRSLWNRFRGGPRVRDR